jgi:hypothetical protein
MFHRIDFIHLKIIILFYSAGYYFHLEMDVILLYLLYNLKHFDMKKNYKTIGIVSFLLLICISVSAQAQAFRRGSLLVSVSEGSTRSNYTTRNITTSETHTRCTPGVRDPFVIEYGISRRWGLGLTSGNDIFKVRSSPYGLRTSGDLVTSKTNEFTFDANYHVFTNKRLDLSVFLSMGMFSVNMKGTDGDNSYNYTANGNIIRVGTRARYYFWKRLGAIGMISSYAANSSPKNVRGNTFGNNYSTSLNGITVEMGLCYRILK